MDGFIRKKSKMCYFDQNAHFMDEIKKNKSPEKCNMRFFSGVRKEVKSPGHCWKGLTKWQVGKFGFKWRCVWCGQKCEYEDDYRNKKGILKIIDKNGGIGKNFAPISTVYLSKKLRFDI